jgi:hypothetical protein
MKTTVATSWATCPTLFTPSTRYALPTPYFMSNFTTHFSSSLSTSPSSDRAAEHQMSPSFVHRRHHLQTHRHIYLSPPNPWRHFSRPLQSTCRKHVEEHSRRGVPPSGTVLPTAWIVRTISSNIMLFNAIAFDYESRFVVV